MLWTTITEWIILFLKSALLLLLTKAFQSIFSIPDQKLQSLFCHYHEDNSKFSQVEAYDHTIVLQGWTSPIYYDGSQW